MAGRAIGRVVGIGCDLQSHDPVRAAWAAHGDRYLTRVLAPSERATAPLTVASIAARYAVKEAVAKALRVRSEDPLPWTDIVVHLAGQAGVGGRTEVELRGAAAGYAAWLQISDWVIEVQENFDPVAAPRAVPTEVDRKIDPVTDRQRNTPNMSQATAIAMTGAKSCIQAG